MKNDNFFLRGYVVSDDAGDSYDMVFTGNLGFDEQWLALEYDTNPGEYEYYDVTYDEHNLHIGANSEFDFDGNGTDEEVIFFLDMVR